MQWAANHELHGRTGVVFNGLLASLSPVPREFRRSPMKEARMPLHHSRQVATVLLVTTQLVGCVGNSKRVTWRHEDPMAMETSVASLVPAGMSIDDAIARMENEGFDCTVTRNGTFREMRHWSDDGPDHDNLDFIRCRRTNSNAGFLMSRIWNVAILLDGDVTEGSVLVSHFVDGP